uniref:Uncharacterized protein n=1 Tax=Schistocephalus solidus TaxID=70667 RepID=A0A0X3NU08_SCHSO
MCNFSEHQNFIIFLVSPVSQDKSSCKISTSSIGINLHFLLPGTGHPMNILSTVLRICVIHTVFVVGASVSDKSSDFLVDCDQAFPCDTMWGDCLVVLAGLTFMFLVMYNLISSIV